MSLLPLLWVLSATVPSVAEVTHTKLAREHTIFVSNDVPFYAPATLVIRAGEKVHWRSGTRSDTHSVREALHGTFSLDIPPGGEVTYHFRRTGEYRYRCRYHPWMVGTIVVEPRRLTVDWQPLPEALRSGRFVSGEGGSFIVGPGARPEIARLHNGHVLPLRALTSAIAPEVRPGVGGDGTLWFAGQSPGTLVSFSPSTKTSTVHPIPVERRPLRPPRSGENDAGNPAAGSGRRSTVTALAPAADGTVWFHDLPSRRIGQYVPETATVNWTSAPELDEPLAAMRAGADGLLWLLGRAGQAGHLDPGNQTAHVSLRTMPVGPDLAAGRGAAWMVSSGRGKILRLDEEGAVVEFTVPPAIANPGLLVPAGEAVWIMRREGSIAQLVDGQIEEYAVSPPGNGFGDMAAGSKDEWWLLDAQKQRLGHFSAEVRTLAPLQ